MCVLVAQEDATQLLERLPGTQPHLRDLLGKLTAEDDEWVLDSPPLRITRFEPLVISNEEGASDAASVALGEYWDRGIDGFIMLRGKASDTNAFMGILRTVVERCRTQVLPIVVVDLVPNPPDLHEILPKEEDCTTFPSVSSDDTNPYSAEELCSFVLGAVRFIGDKTQRLPHVGVGVLLLDRKSNFLLVERLKDPGRMTYGTFGGALQMNETVESALNRYANKEVGLSDGNIAVCELLSCTNMRRDRLHYVDMTFLAVVKSTKPTITIGNSQTHARLPDSDSSWFSLSKVISFYTDNKLFQPVACAFERFCRLALWGAMCRSLHFRTYGESPQIPAPEFYGGLHQLQVFPNLNQIQDLLTNPTKAVVSPRLLPLFFESEPDARLRQESQ